MDQKTIEMNNLRVLHDYLNQTIDVLVRGQRLGHGGQQAGLPFSSFGGTPFGGASFGGASFGGAIPGAGIGAGVDVVYGPNAGWAGSPMFSHAAPYQASNPFTGMPIYGAGYVDPFVAQRGLGVAGGSFGSWQQPWSPIAEATRQATVAQALVAKQSVLEAMCRVCGIPV